MKISVPLRAKTAETISPFEDVAYAAEWMEKHHAERLIVVSKGRPIGVLTLDHIDRAKLLHASKLDCLLVKDIMTPDVEWAYDDVELQDALQIMNRQGLDQLLVRWRDGGILGLLVRDELEADEPGLQQARQLFGSSRAPFHGWPETLHFVA